MPFLLTERTMKRWRSMRAVQGTLATPSETGVEKEECSFDNRT